MCPCHHRPAPALCCDAACTGTNAMCTPTSLSPYPRQPRDPFHWHSMGSRAGSFASAGRGSVTAVSGGNGNGGGRSNTSSTTAARSNVEAEAAAKVQMHSRRLFGLLGADTCLYVAPQRCTCTRCIRSHRLKAAAHRLQFVTHVHEAHKHTVLLCRRRCVVLQTQMPRSGRSHRLRMHLCCGSPRRSASKRSCVAATPLEALCEPQPGLL